MAIGSGMTGNDCNQKGIIDSLKEYQCHKRVKAAKIANAAQSNDHIHGYALVLENGERVTVTLDWANEKIRGHASGEDMGYLVRYEDGYLSWSPSHAFESGYTLIDDSEPADRTMGNTDVNGARKNVSDLEVFGDGDTFKLICKASSQREGWMKSTKAMETNTGCVVQVTTQQRNPDGSYSVAEALTFVPGVAIVEGEDGTRWLQS